MAFTIAVAQCNPVAGDLVANARMISEAARHAHAKGAQVLLLAENALTGTPLHDLTYRPAFVHACQAKIEELADELAVLNGITIALIHPSLEGAGNVQRALSLLSCGRCVTHYAEADWAAFFVEIDGFHLALLADSVVNEAAVSDALKADAQLIVVAGCQPYRMEQVQHREMTLSILAKRFDIPFISTHLVGGNDEWVYDGGSFAVQANGVLAGRAEQFSQTLWLVDALFLESGLTLRATTAAVEKSDGQIGCAPFVQRFSHAEVWRALVLGTRDYVRKSGFHDVIIGLSGGVDSALVLALAVDALGSDHVRTVMMPSTHTAEISLLDAQEMALRLGVQHDVIPIAPLCDAFDDALVSLFTGRNTDVTEENLQARIRGNLLMALSNKFGALVLATGNKSELSTGYCTLYGDMAGGFAPLKDVLKTQVYALAHWRNSNNPFGVCEAPIPERIITRAPSAELRPDQTDQDSLPPYDLLDAVVIGYMENNATLRQLLSSGLPDDAVQKIVSLIRTNEYKRQQAAPGICISRRAYGCDWHYPLTNRFDESVLME